MSDFFALLGTVVVAVGAAYGVWRTGRKSDADADKTEADADVAHTGALATLDPIIARWLTRMEGEIAVLRGEIGVLRVENTELRAEIDVLRTRLKTESRLRRQAESLLIEHRIIDATGDE